MSKKYRNFLIKIRPYAVMSVLGLLAVGFLVVESITRVDAQAVTDITQCQNITANGNYRLANDVSSSGTCFSIRGNVSSLTFDGNGKTITVGSGDALEVADYGSGSPHHVTVNNFSSNSGVRTYGDVIHHITFSNLSVDGITVFGSDDVSISNNTVGGGGINVNNADRPWAPYRPSITNNTITGPVGHTTKILLEIAGYTVHPCPRIDGVVSGNTVTNYRNDPPPEATADIRIRCATHNTVTDNFFRSAGTTIGLYIRDESDDGIYLRNTFWVDSQEAIRIASGNNDKTFPARNVFQNNIFRSDTGPSTFLQGVGDSNVFQNNIFWSATQGQLYSAAHGTIFDHNTFYTKNTNTAIQVMANKTAPADSWTNNIFSYSGPQIFNYDAPWSFSLYTADNNLFQNRSGSVSFGGPANSLASWRANSGNSDDVHSLETNPLFVDAATGDFHLQQVSPARGAGTGGSDIGALPYSSNGSCTENWQCSAWSTCSNASQARTCVDLNNCGLLTNRPALTQSCGTPPPNGYTDTTAPAAINSLFAS